MAGSHLSAEDQLHVIDDGLGFSESAIQGLATLGASDKIDVAYSRANRHYLGSYGYGLRSSLNIAKRIDLFSSSEQGVFEGSIDWSRLDEALRPDFKGFDFLHSKPSKTQPRGTHITINLRNPFSKERLEDIGAVLANLPRNGGGFVTAYGLLDALPSYARSDLFALKRISKIARQHLKSGVLKSPSDSRDADLEDCQKIELTDKKDRSVKAAIFFAGLDGGNVKQLKPGLRGIYVRIHGRLLKQSFTNREFTYKISRWVKFESGLRVEITVDWLRDQITLSREGVRFSNDKVKSEFQDVLYRLVSGFIQPILKKLDNKKERTLSRKHDQRLDLAKKRIQGGKGVKLNGFNAGFAFRPECETELALRNRPGNRVLT